MPFSRDIFDPPSRLEQISTFPLNHLITTTYSFFSSLRPLPQPPQNPIRVICISDTHTQQTTIPNGDILIHAGDLTNKGTPSELQAQIDWLASLPHPHKFAIAGNHDTFLDPSSRSTLSESDQKERLDWKDVTYLQNSSVKVTFPSGRILNIYGAPHIPKCGGSNFAFQYNREEDIWENTVPSNTDILVTHTPPKYHRDLQSPWLGCKFLLKEIWRVRPTLHVFGHIHAASGKEVVWWDGLQRVYERCMASTQRKGFVRQVFSVRLWWDFVWVLGYGVMAVLGSWVGSRQRIRGTILVNAALMDWRTGRLGNTVQVVDI